MLSTPLYGLRKEMSLPSGEISAPEISGSSKNSSRSMRGGSPAGTWATGAAARAVAAGGGGGGGGGGGAGGGGGGASAQAPTERTSRPRGSQGARMGGPPFVGGRSLATTGQAIDRQTKPSRRPHANSAGPEAILPRPCTPRCSPSGLSPWIF